MALNTNSPLAARKFRADASEILKRQIRRGNRPHPFHALGQLLLDEFREQLGEADKTNDESEIKERMLAEKLSQIEKTISDGHHLFPGDSYLLSLESQVATALRDSPRALFALKKAHLNNPHNEHIAARLSRMLADQGENDESRAVLERSIEANPMAKRVRLQLAKTMIDENEDVNRDEIRRLLRSAFTDGDTHYEIQFWYARHEYLFGDRETGVRGFKDLSAIKTAPNVRNRRLSLLKEQSGKPKRFRGSVTGIRDTFCFVNVPELNGDVFVHHSECSESEWSELRIGTYVNVSVAFSFKGPQGIDMLLDR